MPDLVATRDVEALNDWLGHASTVEIAEELARLDPAERAIPFRLLAKDRALEVFEALDPLHQQELLEGLREEGVRQLFEDMDPDDRARLVDEMPAKVARQLLAGLSPHERALTSKLLGYPENSAGRVMSPEVANLRANMTVAQALERLRRTGGKAETIYALPVTDDQRRLVGALGLRDLVLADPETKVGDLMDREVYSARVDEDQEAVARLMLEANLLALPIVDAENRLVGIVTVDDAMQILEEEQTEDVARAGGAEPLTHPYLSTSVFGIARSRVVWLLVLIVAATLTVNVLATFEDSLARVVALALFIPLVIGTGGNTGSQSATTITRALAVGEIRGTDVALVVLREVRVGFLLGAILAVIAYLPALLFVNLRTLEGQFAQQVGLVVSLTLLVVCTLATLVGSLLPLLARRLGFDPAVMSAPLITTLVDATGLVVYFLIAQIVLGI
ncbi:MAG TPA: magnesium transporter [Candidatus Caenarcaniphilales bacterium]|nr:magnesium transporter [Candidatus Caenarcaniphilales bacterium]